MGRRICLEDEKRSRTRKEDERRSVEEKRTRCAKEAKEVKKEIVYKEKMRSGQG